MGKGAQNAFGEPWLSVARAPGLNLRSVLVLAVLRGNNGFDVDGADHEELLKKLFDVLAHTFAKSGQMGGGKAL